MNNKLTFIIKFYQSVVLTVIAVFLILLVQKTPTPATVGNIKSGKLAKEDIPFTRGAGNVDVTNTVTVEVDNIVTVENNE